MSYAYTRARPHKSRPGKRPRTKKRAANRKKAMKSPVKLYLEGLAPSCQKSMESRLRCALEMMDIKVSIERYDWRKFGYGQLCELRTRMQSYGYAANTIHTTLYAVKGVLRALMRLGLISNEEFASISQCQTRSTEKVRQGITLSRAQIRNMLKISKQSVSHSSLRNAALLSLLVFCGLRRNEAVMLNVEDILFDRKEVLVRAAKGGKFRRVPVPAVAIRNLNAWLKQRDRYQHYDETDPLFVGVTRTGEMKDSRLTTQAVYQMVKSVGLELGMPDLAPHDLRRTYITTLLSRGVDLNVVRQAAGHSDIQTTTMYDLRDWSHVKKAGRVWDNF